MIMPKIALTEEEKIKNRINRDVKTYMDSVHKFLMGANGGEIPPEYSCSLLMLESYYKQLLIFNSEIDQLDSYIVDTRYGKQPNAILKARDATVQKLDVLLKSLGLTYREQLKLNLVDTKVEESPLESLMKGRIEKR